MIAEIDCWKNIIYQTEATNAILTYEFCVSFHLVVFILQLNLTEYKEVSNEW